MAMVDNKAEELAEMYLGITMGAFVQLKWSDAEILARCQFILDGIRTSVDDPKTRKAFDNIRKRVSRARHRRSSRPRSA